MITQIQFWCNSKIKKNTVQSERCHGGDNRARTYDPLLVRQMLSQLSYTPTSAFTHLRVSATGIIILHFQENVKCFLKKIKNIFSICIICMRFTFDNTFTGIVSNIFCYFTYCTASKAVNFFKVHSFSVCSDKL